jgi:hypothetical protein
VDDVAPIAAAASKARGSSCDRNQPRLPAESDERVSTIGECEESRREALVAMVHTTDLGDRDDFSDLGNLYRPLLRAILVQ